MILFHELSGFQCEQGPQYKFADLYIGVYFSQTSLMTVVVMYLTLQSVILCRDQQYDLHTLEQYSH